MKKKIIDVACFKPTGDECFERVDALCVDNASFDQLMAVNALCKDGYRVEITHREIELDRFPASPKDA